MAVVASLKKATPATSPPQPPPPPPPPPHPPHLPLSPPSVPHRLLHVSSSHPSPTSAARSPSTTLTTRRIPKSTTSRSNRIRIWSLYPAGCRSVVCGRFSGDCRRRDFCRRREFVKGGERRRRGCGEQPRSSGLGFRPELRSGLLDRCCRSVRGWLDSVLEWKG